MNSPPKEKPLLGGEGLRELTTRARYHALHLLQAPFGFAFWATQIPAARSDRQREERS
jgi:hypothetical protein